MNGLCLTCCYPDAKDYSMNTKPQDCINYGKVSADLKGMSDQSYFVGGVAGYAGNVFYSINEGGVSVHSDSSNYSMSQVVAAGVAGYADSVEYCKNHELKCINAFKYLLKLNEIKNKLNYCSGNIEFLNKKNNLEYVYDKFGEDIDNRICDSMEYDQFSYIFYILALKNKYSNDYSILKDKLYSFFDKISLYFPDLVKMDENDREDYNKSYWASCLNSNNLNNFEIIKKKCFEKYLTKDFFNNCDDFYKNLIDKKLKNCINNEDKTIFLPSINSTNKVIPSSHLYDNYNVHIFINLILFSIDKKFAFKTYFEDFEMFENDNLIFSEYPLILDNSYELFAVFNYFHKNAPQHFSLLTVKNDKLVENFSKSEIYIKNMLYEKTSTAIGAYIYEKKNDISSLNLYHSLEFFVNIKNIKDYKKNIIEYNNYLIQSLYENYKKINTNNNLIKFFKNDSYKNIYIEENKKLEDEKNIYINQILKNSNYIINDLDNNCKNILCDYLEIKIDDFKKKFDECKYDEKNIFLFLNSVFFHRLYAGDNIQNADKDYLEFVK